MQRSLLLCALSLLFSSIFGNLFKICLVWWLISVWLSLCCVCACVLEFQCVCESDCVHQSVTGLSVPWHLFPVFLKCKWGKRTKLDSLPRQQENRPWVFWIRRDVFGGVCVWVCARVCVLCIFVLTFCFHSDSQWTLRSLIRPAGAPSVTHRPPPADPHTLSPRLCSLSILSPQGELQTAQTRSLTSMTRWKLTSCHLGIEGPVWLPQPYLSLLQNRKQGVCSVSRNVVRQEQVYLLLWGQFRIWQYYFTLCTFYSTYNQTHWST